jgi:HPt (histidine-containing phosphotransfer) domain-containing protein
MTDNLIEHAAYAELRDTVGDDFAVELLDTFLEEAPGMLAALRDTAAVRDEEGFRRAAHSIKSNATTLGATALADIARRLELDGVDAALITDLEAVHERTETALREMRDGA